METGQCVSGCYQSPRSTESEITEKRIKTIKAMREDLVSFMGIKEHISNRETSLCVTKLEEARMWMGKLLGKLGTEYPYPESMDPASKKIEPPTDMPAEKKNLFCESDNVANLKALRAAITDMLSRFNNIVGPIADGCNVLEIISIQQKLTEANMWAGVALGNMRGDQNK
ncbi:MAG: hypothetical protein HF307_19470 [Ignavibacteria bacterium]|jgi:hypothetical protein|nr:hypothetical protein [Ignavibacteria bacterium]